MPVAFVEAITGDPHPLKGPDGMALDPHGNLYVVDGKNDRIQKFDPNGQFLAMWGSQGTGDGQFNFATSDGEALGDLTVDGQGNIFVADFGNHRIQKFDPDGRFLLKWGRPGRFEPDGLAVDGQGNIYTLEFDLSRIQVFDSTGQFRFSWGNSGTGDGQLNGPSELAVDSAGTIYVSDYLNNRIQKFRYR
jgi:DNA-binding beta-propeller fold protein YncE